MYQTAKANRAGACFGVMTQKIVSVGHEYHKYGKICIYCKLTFNVSLLLIYFLSFDTDDMGSSASQKYEHNLHKNVSNKLFVVSEF